MVMGVDMCSFMKAHKARSWNNLNLIWFWFSASPNAPDLEMGRPPLGYGESSNASQDGTITVPEALSTTPRILQEVLASGLQALEIASELTGSGWHNKLLSILLGWGGRSIKSFGVLVAIIDQDTTIMYWTWI